MLSVHNKSLAITTSLSARSLSIFFLSDVFTEPEGLSLTVPQAGVHRVNADQ